MPHFTKQQWDLAIREIEIFLGSYTMSSESLSHKFIAFDRKPAYIAYGIGLFVLAALVAFLPLLVLLAVAVGAPILYFIGRQWLRHPWLIWLYIAALLPILSLAKIGPASGADAIIAVAIGLWLLRGIEQRSLRITISFPAILFSVYASFLLLSFFNAVDLVEAFGEVVKWVELWFVLLIVREMIPTEKMPLLVGALLLGGILQSAMGIGQFFLRIGPSWFMVLGRFMRASGTFGQPNPYAGYLGLCLPVAASLLLWVIFKRPSKSQFNLKNSLYLLAATLLITAGLFFSWSRGGWLGAMAALSVVIVLYDRRSIFVGGVLTAVVATLILLASTEITVLPKPIMDRFSDVPALLEKSTKGIDQILNEQLTSENFGAMERAAHWSAAVKMWDQAPWFGVGPGNYAYAYPDIVRSDNRLRRWDDPLGHAHNIYLNVLAEGGIVGIVLYLFVWGGIAWWICTKIRRRVGWHRALAVGVLGIMVHLHVHNIFDNLFVQGMYLHIGLWLTTLLYEPES